MSKMDSAAVSGRVSCIILSYRRFELIYEAIASVLEQDYPDIELIIFDDCSDVFPKQEISDYIAKNKRDNIKNYVVYRNETNIGTVQNDYHAIQIATGEYIMNCGDDDVLYDAHVISRLVDEFHRSGSKIITTKLEYYDREKQKSLGVFPDQKTIGLVRNSSPNQLFNIQVVTPIFRAGTYMTREIALKYSMADTECRFMEDYGMFLRCSRNGEKIHFADFISIRYSYGAGISTTSNSKRLINDHLITYRDEVLAYPQQLSFRSRCYAKFNCDRFLLKKEDRTGLPDKIGLCLKHPVGAVIHLSAMWYFRSISKRLRAAGQGGS